MNTSPEQQLLHVRINCSIEGDPAAWLIELKRRRIIGSNKEAVVHGLRALHDQLLKSDTAQHLLSEVESQVDTHTESQYGALIGRTKPANRPPRENEGKIHQNAFQ